MMQFNMYHHYTVDEHLIRAVGHLSAIERGRLSEDHPLSTAIFPTITSRRLLYVAVFLHDIAKGRKEDHSIAGERIASARSAAPEESHQSSVRVRRTPSARSVSLIGPPAAGSGPSPSASDGPGRP